VEEMTIVTAFFDVGRAKWPGFGRDSSKYVEYFKFWARMKNTIVVYTDRNTAEQVLDIRGSFGLKARTFTVIAEDISTFDHDVYRSIENALSHELAIKFRKKPTCPECYNALYDYLMYLKPHFVADAVQKGLADGMIAWMDFGYNHGGEFFTNPMDFDFLWKYDFSPKIHIFAINPLENTPIFEVVRTMKTYVAGGLIAAPAELWETLRLLFRKAILGLASCGLMDDDQTLLIMAYRERPELFEIHSIDDFYFPLKNCGGSHLASVPLKQSRKSRKTAQKCWKAGEFHQALKWYLKYAAEKMQSK